MHTTLTQPPPAVVERRLAVLRQQPAEEFGDIPPEAVSHLRHINRFAQAKRLNRSGAR